jgi:hypothetical protein
MLGGRELEETATPELEPVGLCSQELPGWSQEMTGRRDQGGGRATGGAAVARGTASGHRDAARRPVGDAGAVCEEEVTAKQALFPIFRPKSSRKCVILVRHGESGEVVHG